MHLAGAIIDTTGDVWFYTPTNHKTAWKGKARGYRDRSEVAGGVKPFFTENPTDYIFSPRQGDQEFTRSGGQSEDAALPFAREAQREAAGNEPCAGPAPR